MASEAWPPIPIGSWRDSLDTLHLWSQIVGKTRLALGPRHDHWRRAPLYLNSVGLTTSLMPLGVRGGLEVVFDLREHQLHLRLTDGRERRLRLEPRSVRDFYSEYLSKLGALDVEVTLEPMPAEIDGAIPFSADTVRSSYDADAVHQYYRALVSAHRVLTRFRGDVRPPCGPVHFGWGRFDLSVTASGVSRYGYWPGGADEGVFFADVQPPPPGLRDHAPELPGPYFDDSLGEFVLPYATARSAVDPDAYVVDFLTEVHALTSVGRSGA